MVEFFTLLTMNYNETIGICANRYNAETAGPHHDIVATDEYWWHTLAMIANGAWLIPLSI